MDSGASALGVWVLGVLPIGKSVGMRGERRENKRRREGKRVG
jgi:hypothetical protein